MLIHIVITNDKIMSSRIPILFILSLLLEVNTVYAQDKLYHLNTGLFGYYSGSGSIPFWLRSGQHGSIPQDGTSVSIITSAGKEYSGGDKLFDWGGSVEGRFDIGNKTRISLIEAYVKTKLSIFEFGAGRSKSIIGLCDTTLSAGSFSVSGNSLGVPQISISIPDYFTIPLMGNLFAFKGSFSHGWIGETTVRLINNDTADLKTYLHQKSFYGRFGKSEWKWKIYGGFNHHAFWGSEDIYYLSFNTLSKFETYLYVISGKPYGTENFASSKIGNHLGSIDLGFEYNFNNIRMLVYRQNIYDIGALYYLANIRDGLNGVSLTNMRSSEKTIQWRKMLFEFFYTKNQAGELWSPYTPSGDENYYNNDQYVFGWSYKGIGIGNPFICKRDYTRDGLPANPRDYFINNRVAVFHYGIEGSIKDWLVFMKASYSLNYGTFGTDEVGHTLGKVRTLPLHGVFQETKQLSFLLRLNRKLRSGFLLDFAAAFDAGRLYYNSAGVMAGVTKMF
jgi:hypothetical protein